MRIQQIRLRSLVTVKRAGRDRPLARVRRIAGGVFWGVAAAVAAAAWYVLGCAYFPG